METILPLIQFSIYKDGATSVLRAEMHYGDKGNKLVYGHEVADMPLVSENALKILSASASALANTLVQIAVNR